MKLIDGILNRAQHPMYAWVVFLMTVCESIFLFIPPEVFMTPAIVANRRRALPVTLAAAAGSLVGGALAYIIGAALFDTVGMWLINTFASPAQFAAAQAMFIKYGMLIIVLAAFSPIPYKLMSLCAGFIGFPALTFLGLTAVFRTARFAITGALLWRFQSTANTIVRKYFWQLVVAAIAAAIIGLLILLAF